MGGKEKPEPVLGFFVSGTQENLISLRGGENVYDLLAYDAAIEIGLAAVTEGDDTFCHSQKRVVFRDLYVLSGHNLRTALADDDHAWAS